MTTYLRISWELIVLVLLSIGCAVVRLWLGNPPRLLNDPLFTFMIGLSVGGILCLRWAKRNCPR